MNNKFIFFDIRRNWIVTILVTVEIALWIFYTASLVSLINFDNSYRNRYNRAIPVNNSEVIKFYKVILNDDYFENKDVYDSYIKESLKVVSNNNYTYGFVQRDNYEEIPIESFGLNLDNLQSNFTMMDKFNSLTNPIGFNYGMIENYKKNIIGEISEEEWIRNDNFIPIIIGSEIAKKLKIGDTYEVNNINYKVIGEFKKDTLAYDYTNTVDSSFLLNTSFVIPLSEDKYFENFNGEPITIFFNGDMETGAAKINKEIQDVSKDIVISSSSEDLDKFLDELKSKKYYEICRILIVSIIASASIFTTISYKINRDRDRIGILYSFGTTKRNIFKIFSGEFFISIFIGIIGGSIFYLKKCASVYVFFINENIYLNLFLSLGILLLLIFSIMLLGFNQINKLTPKEMIGGFVE
ncbi:FtsX-like permease family protein [Clostridium sp. DSM 8431]|uniref:FtsX-like permease family protein n=1 Tax=Clostridium sp. DSM 8431 TaxID=1761781 RepID=UPI0008E82D1C|nr:FtsX-like permease family protein [Clostridium sp. DSM 8431]SFU86556.1 FtsX-like permease family protein [Clostridium sp. DSM 8431]